MKIHILTIFPETFESYFGSSIIGRAIEKGLFTPVYYKLNDFSSDKFKRIDEKAYGMHGQVISPEPLSKAVNHIFDVVGKKLPVVYMTPSGDLLNQEKVENYYDKLGEEFVVICGHYEGIDQRIIDLYVTYKISVGEYVLSSGELATQVFIDTLVRHIPGVLGNIDSLEEDSFSKKLNRQKEYPVYTRPEEFEGLKVPGILLSGNHKEIEKWKKDNLG
ncbi:MAG: tRNA (guanosine(37)-N1)-methyltransferase TrmD [Candidatus Gracilibacteria bacterium]|nr:tRNA (guanosine(37)-N1)-methyltransferase TrmD [Candidatus Gracilibacteria bacterium]